MLDFLLLYEHVVREYESILLIKAELEKRGYSVAIRQLLDRKQLRYFTYKKPKVVLTSCMYNNEGLNSHIFNNVGICNKVINLHWEQVLSSTQEISPFFNCGENAARCIHTCWGKAAQKRLIDHGVKEHNLEVTGAIQLDFLREEFSGYYMNKRELCEAFNLDPEKRLFLYISSYAFAYMSQNEVDEISAMAGVPFDKFKATNYRSMNETLQWFAALLQQYSDIELVYRSHPSEWNSDVLDDMKTKYKNFHVIIDHSVKQWIVAADLIYLWMSTSLAEVYFAGKSCRILRPFEIEQEYDPVIYQNAEFITTKEDFLQSVTSYDNSYFPFDLQLLTSHYDEAKKPSYIRIADLCEQVLHSPPRDYPFSEGYTPKFNFVKFVSLLGLAIMHKFKINPLSFKMIAPSLSVWASRIYGYIDKSRVDIKKSHEMQKNIEKYL